MHFDPEPAWALSLFMVLCNVYTRAIFDFATSVPVTLSKPVHLHASSCIFVSFLSCPGLP
eukprot:m.360633 g.360633  ORF g.360633 m.360633 type:complete len:60 (-) comp19130_c0_seq1:51-230(-)